MEELITLEKIVTTLWESLAIIGGIFLLFIIWMVVNRDNFKND